MKYDCQKSTLASHKIKNCYETGTFTTTYAEVSQLLQLRSFQRRTLGKFRVSAPKRKPADRLIHLRECNESMLYFRDLKQFGVSDYVVN